MASGAFNQGSANKSTQVFNLITRARISHRAAFATALGLALTFALLLAACGDGGDVQIIALTPTPTPAPADGGVSPTQIAPPTSITATATVEPSAELPPRPANPLASGLAVAGYLAGGSADLAGCLPELVSAWQLAPTLGARCLFADIDGDGEGEFAFAVTLIDGPGDVWFFQGSDESFRLFSSARVLANQVLEEVTIEATDDLTGDRFPELVISALLCDANTCTTRFVIASAHNGILEDMMPPGIEISGAAAVRVEDVVGDELADVIIAGGTAPTPGGGPPRSSELVLNWGGLRFFEREQFDAPRYLFHAIVDADEAFAAGEHAQARGLYEAAVADTALVDWRVEQGTGSGRAELSAYALFRAGLAAQRMNDDAGLIALLDRALASYGATLHGQVAAIYREATLAQVPAGLSCAAVEEFLQAQTSRFNAIWDYGFDNPEHRISDICS